MDDVGSDIVVDTGCEVICLDLVCRAIAVGGREMSGIIQPYNCFYICHGY